MSESAGLRFVTRRLDRDLDLAAVAGPSGVLWARGRAGLAGAGIAARLPLAHAADALATMDVDDEVRRPGCGPVAFGALPFRPGSAPTMVVPEVVVGRDEDGTRWITTVGPHARVSLHTNPRPEHEPIEYRVRSGVHPVEWCELVDRATKAMADGPLRKVVLAREVVVSADVDHDVPTIVARLRAAYPGCYVFAIDGFVGASPELLVSRHGDIVRSHPMAGTAARGGDPTTDARLAASLLASTKDRDEHQITIDMVHQSLLGWCSYLDYEAQPSVIPLANVQHLATMVEGRLSNPAPSVLELVAALHPTPAVCGWPRDEALAFIAEHEGIDRGRYTGAVGWVDGRGNGAWAVSVRCAQIDGPVARLYAGNGIMVDSDPETELAETRTKLGAMLSAVVRP